MKNFAPRTLAATLALALTLLATDARASLLQIMLGAWGEVLVYTLLLPFPLYGGGVDLEEKPTSGAPEAKPRQEGFKFLKKPRDAFKGNLNFAMGAKFLNHAQWKPFNTQVAVGIHYDGAISDDGTVALVVDLLSGFESVEQFDKLDVAGNPLMLDSFTVEVGTGLRKYLGEPLKSAWFFGAGPAWIYGEISEGDRNLASDGNLGYWLSAGYVYLLKERLNVGGELRYSSALVSMYNDRHVDAGGLAILLHLGYSW